MPLLPHTTILFPIYPISIPTLTINIYHIEHFIAILQYLPFNTLMPSIPIFLTNMFQKIIVSYCYISFHLFILFDNSENL